MVPPLGGVGGASFQVGGLLPGGVPLSGGVSFPGEPLSGGVSFPGGCLFPGGLLPRGCLIVGISFPGGASFLGGAVSSWGGLLPGGPCLPACTEADPPCEQNHTHV